MAATLKTDTRQKIIDSTLSLISTRDVNEISLQDIANAANITKGTLFYYYNSKELIFEDITIEYLNGLATRYYEWINNADKDTSFPRLAKYVLDFGARYGERSKVHIYLVNKALSDNKQLCELFREKYLSWREIIKKTIEERIDEKEKAEGYADLLLILIDGLIVQDLVGIENIDTKQIVSLIIDK
ncbi:MAG: TetR/AcrR family transcriptional regulator [Clostridiales bacterium]|nr:TetR/AcrR family transcriptional regulator [Clostridiales bacterium]MCI7202255.1 TetR/AcrR family transcriptional regulator [Clostridiales bacterium]MDD7054095.1 TetR/AcrR family transcriptional regulator [Clostridiales bacterium]MDY5190671.1 TetR/AcrR family transcriptional regulator [Eubacteriales bacterium]